jgi:hypothetical protein
MINDLKTVLQSQMGGRCLARLRSGPGSLRTLGVQIAQNEFTSVKSKVDGLALGVTIGTSFTVDSALILWVGEERNMQSRRHTLLLLALAPASAAWFRRETVAPPVDTTLVPTILSGSHNLKGYGPQCAVDGKSHTYWLVPGGQRMEMMSRDKWLVLDLGEERTVSALSVRGVVSSFAPARVRLQVGESAEGPWEHVSSFRAMRAPLRWQRIELDTPQPPSSRFFRLHIRREGHANFRHAVHGVLFHCDPLDDTEHAPRHDQQYNQS